MKPIKAAAENERRFAVAATVQLLENFDGPRLRVLAKFTHDVGHLRRLLALTETYDGRSCSKAAQIPIVSTTAAVGREKQEFCILIRKRNTL